MSPHHATILRRLLLFAAALAATLVAHAISTGEMHAVPAAPLIWGSSAALIVITGRVRAPAWRRHGAPEILVRLLALQAGLHLLMTAAPWAFGLGVHHRAALVTPLAIAAHGAAAILLTVLLARAERLLALAQAVVAAVRAALAPHPARARHPARVGPGSHRIPADPGPRRVRVRGPPLLAG